MSGWRYLLKSPSFYWHTGYKHVAIMGTLMSGVLVSLSVQLMCINLSNIEWGVVVLMVALTTALDMMAIVLLLAYLLLRSHVPDAILFVDVKSRLDMFVVWLLYPIVTSVVVNRMATFTVAKLCGYPFVQRDQTVHN